MQLSKLIWKKVMSLTYSWVSVRAWWADTESKLSKTADGLIFQVLMPQSPEVYPHRHLAASHRPLQLKYKTVTKIFFKPYKSFKLWENKNMKKILYLIVLHL